MLGPVRLIQPEPKKKPVKTSKNRQIKAKQLSLFKLVLVGRDGRDVHLGGSLSVPSPS